MKKTQVKVIHEVGLHARPAALFVGLAGKHRAEIRLRNLTIDSRWCNGKSILGVLSLGVEKDHTIEIEVEGEDEAEAVAALEALVRGNFNGSG